jgi:hypothetical protein
MEHGTWNMEHEPLKKQGFGSRVSGARSAPKNSQGVFWVTFQKSRKILCQKQGFWRPLAGLVFWIWFFDSQ